MAAFVQICIDGLVAGSVYAVVALGFSLVYRVTGAVNLSQGGFCLLAALMLYTFSQSWGWPLPLAIAAAVASTVAVGTVAGGLTFVPALQRLSNPNVLMLTVGMLTMIEGAALVVWGSQPYALPPFTGDLPVSAGPIRVPTQAFWVLGTATVIFVSVWCLVAFTRLGRALRACAENPAAASLMGIRVSRMMLLSFALASLLAALAGVTVAPTMTLQFDTGRLFTILGFVAAVVGGITSFPGAIVGGLALGLAQQLATAYLSSLFAGTITLVVLLAVLALRPNGVMASKVVRREDARDHMRVPPQLLRMPTTAGRLIAAAGLAGALAVPFVVTDNGVLSGIVIAEILFIALIGLDIGMGYAGQVNLGQAGFMATGGYTSGYLAVTYGIDPVVATAAGVAVSVACALVLSVVTLRLRGLYLALATLAFGLLIDSLAIGLIDVTGGPSGLIGIPPFSVGPVAFAAPRDMHFLVVAVIAIVLALTTGLMGGGFGRTLKAIRTDQLAAAALGVDVVRYKTIAFVLGAALASLAGSLYAFFFNFLSPEMVGTSRSLELVAMLVIGGEGTLVGGLFGSLFLTLMPVAFQPFAVYKTVITGALLVVSFLYLPGGVVGAVARVVSGGVAARGRAVARPAPGGAP